MTEFDFLERVIAEAIAEMETYTDSAKRPQRDGGIAGLTACRGLDDQALLALKNDADARVERKRADQAAADDYWYWRYYALQIEWVLNVLSAKRYTCGEPTPTAPTARGLTMAIRILKQCS